MSPTLVGCSISMIACTLLGQPRSLGLKPRDPSMKRWISRKSHFPKFNVTPFSSRRLSTAFTLASCSSRESPKMMMSSIIHRTPGRPSSILFILFWKYSGGEVIPKGSLRKQYLPNGVMNVVSSSELGERGICQNPELASSFREHLCPCQSEGRSRLVD